MHSKLGLVILAGLSLLMTPLVTSVPQAAAGVPLVLTLQPAAPVAGESFVVSGRLATDMARPAVLQHQLGTYWQSIQQIDTSNTGEFAFTTAIAGGPMAFRVSAPKFSYGGVLHSSVTSPGSVVTPVSQTAALTVSAVLPADAAARATLSFTPVRVGRQVTLQVLRAGVWTTVRSSVQDGAGTAQVPLDSATAGTSSYRARTASQNGAPAVASSAKSVTVAAPPASGWRSVSAGYSSTCGIRTVGSAWCWGSNFYGELGDGTLVNRESPVRVSGGGNWISVASGGSHTCGIKTDGTAWCWGRNDYGELGIASNVSTSVPVKVYGGQNWKSISAGFHHSCGVRTDGSAWCWGWTGSGSNPADRTTVPVRVGTRTWKTVSAGLNFSCGVRSDATAWCWGSNGYSNFGDGTTTSSVGPVRVSGSATWASITAGELHACGRRMDGTAWCWGLRAFAANGDDPDDIQVVPTRVGTATWAALSTAGFHNCGIRSGGSAWCWGPGGSGQLGSNGTPRLQRSPTRVSGAGTWSAISTGEDYSCGVKSDQTAWCWGSNGLGQLGVGGTTDRHVPTAVREPVG